MKERRSPATGSAGLRRRRRWVGCARGAAHVPARPRRDLRAPRGADGGAGRAAARADGARQPRRRRGGRRAAPFTREADRPRARRPSPRPRHGLSGAERPRCLGPLRRGGACRRDRDGDRRRRGTGVSRRRERCNREGRLLLPAHGQEAPARAGGGRAEQPPVHLPRRLRRRVPAAAGRRLPGSRALRPDLLQPGSHVREGHPADRSRDGLLHGRGRVRTGDERRDDHRPGHGHDLHRRPAAREGRNRPGGHGGGAGRRRRPHSPLRRRRPLRHLRRARARTRASNRPRSSRGSCPRTSSTSWTPTR